MAWLRTIRTIIFQPYDRPQPADFLLFTAERNIAAVAVWLGTFQWAFPRRLNYPIGCIQFAGMNKAS
jgi:hypothetical protein